MFQRENHTANSVIGRFNSIVSSQLACVKNRTIIVGVSGGADSVALLRALHCLHVPIVAVNCNFNLRGIESDDDSEFVRALCNDLNIELISENFDTVNLRLPNESIEMACRRLRYDLFDRLRIKHNAVRIAVAHNADDNVETLFLNLMRGSGIRGLAAMPADTGKIIRPLLSIPRTDIIDYLDALGQTYRTDSSNLDSTYRRNFIRNELLPLLRTRWPEVSESVTRSIRNLRGTLSLIDSIESPIVSTVLNAPEEEWCVIPYDQLQDSGDLRTLFWQIISILGGNAKRADELADTLKRTDTISGKRWSFPGGEIITGRKGLGILKGDILRNRTYSNLREDAVEEIDPFKKYKIETLTNTDELTARIKIASNDELWLT